jgi:hypothetical protein
MNGPFLRLFARSRFIYDVVALRALLLPREMRYDTEALVLIVVAAAIAEWFVASGSTRHSVVQGAVAVLLLPDLENLNEAVTRLPTRSPSLDNFA